MTILALSSNGHPIFVKDTAAVLDYAIELETWLAGDALDTEVVTVPAGITLDSDGISGTQIVAWLSGGTNGVDYSVRYDWTTVGGRADGRTIVIRMDVR